MPLFSCLLIFGSRCVPAAQRGRRPSAARRLEQLESGGVLQHGPDLLLPPADERLRTAGLHQLRGRISRLPGLRLYTTGEHAGPLILFIGGFYEAPSDQRLSLKNVYT